MIIFKRAVSYVWADTYILNSLRAFCRPPPEGPECPQEGDIVHIEKNWDT